MSIGEIWEKIELYIVSLWFLFFLIIVVTIDIPMYFGPDWVLLEIGEVLKKNIIPLVAFFFVVAGLIFYYRFEYKLSGSKEITVQVTKIEDVNYEHLGTVN